MIRQVIENCPITQSNTHLLVPWISDSRSKEYKNYGGYHTGVDIEATAVYALCPCVCTYTGYNKEDKNVIKRKF